MWIRNLRLVLPDRSIEHGALRLHGEQIAQIVEGDPPAAQGGQVIDGRGYTAIPGLIDLHGDMLEREIEPRPGTQFPLEIGLFELDKRLAASGITTAYTAIAFHETGVRRSLRTPERATALIDAIDRIHNQLHVDLRVHARFEITHPEIAPLIRHGLDAGIVQLVSLMDHTPGQGQFRDVEAYIERAVAARNLSRADLEAQVHERINRARAHPPDLECVRALVRHARSHDVPIASHDDDSPAKVELVAELGVTICEFPVTIEAAQAARSRGLHVVMGAPNVLRGASHSGNLSARAAIAAGLVDLLASDYYPVSLVHAAFTLAREGRLPLHTAIALVSSNPARALGLHDRGSIAVGKRADLVLVEPAPCPRVRATWRGGVPIYRDSTASMLA